jgi:predicted PurR-regulated permease PerM
MWTMENGLRRPSFLRVIVALAAVVVVLVGLRLAAPILNPILFAVVLALLFGPLYSWLRRRGLPAPLALVIMLVFVGAILAGLFFTLGASISRFTERLGFYTSQLDGQLDDLDALIERLGLSNVDLQDVVKPSALAEALGVVLSGIAGFLSDLFLILAIMLFLLAEGGAMMERLRASVPEDNPQVARLIEVGQNVVRQFGLRAIVNLFTAAGVTVLLLVLGVDFPLLWGILTFFLSFVPYVGARAGVDTGRGLGPGRVRSEPGDAFHRGGDRDQHSGRERALADADGPRAQPLSDRRVLVFHVVGVGARGPRRVPGCAHHPVRDRHAGDVPRDEVVGEPHGR